MSQRPTSDHDAAMRRLRFRLMAGIVAVFTLGLVGYGTWWMLEGRYYVGTDDAYVAGNRLPLTPQIAGTVIAIAADDTDRVEAGQPMIELDRSDELLALDRAEAALGQAVRKVRRIYRQENGQSATVSIRRATLVQARRDYERDRRLLAIGGVTGQQFQHAQTRFHSADAALEEALQRLAALRTQTDGATLRQNPRVRLAVSQVQQAYLDLRRTTIRAPAAGYVAQRRVQIGERVHPGQTLLAIVPLDRLWVDANFKETQLARMRIGQPVRLTADLYGRNVIYHGRVAGLSAGTGAAFELLPPQNATGNWIKIVRRVPVRIALRPDELRQHPLRIGLSMQVEVDVHDTGAPVLAPAPPNKTRYKTDVYRTQDTSGRALIDRIVTANGSVQAAAHPGAERPSSGRP